MPRATRLALEGNGVEKRVPHRLFHRWTSCWIKAKDSANEVDGLFGCSGHQRLELAVGAALGGMELGQERLDAGVRRPMRRQPSKARTDRAAAEHAHDRAKRADGWEAVGYVALTLEQTLSLGGWLPCLWKNEAQLGQNAPERPDINGSRIRQQQANLWRPVIARHNSCSERPADSGLFWGTALVHRNPVAIRGVEARPQAGLVLTDSADVSPIVLREASR